MGWKFEFSQNNGICVPTVKDQLGFAIYGFIVFLTLIASIIVTSIWTYCYTRNISKEEMIEKSTQIVCIYLKKGDSLGCLGCSLHSMSFLTLFLSFLSSLIICFCFSTFLRGISCFHVADDGTEPNGPVILQT